MSEEFLDLIQPGEGLTEIRSILPRGSELGQAVDYKSRVVQTYHSTHWEAVDVALHMSRQGYDAFYGVLPRASRDGANVPAHSHVLWADLDAKSEPEKYTSLRRLLAYPVPPSVIVDSGHGYHAYWRLHKPAQWQHAEPAMRGLAKLLGGDHVYDAPRILRLPGTTNWKDQDNPVPVRLIQFDSVRRFRIGDFDHEISLGTERPNLGPQGEFLYRDDLPEWLSALIRDGAPQGTRSEQSFKVMCSLVRMGWSDEAIRNVFQTTGIGEKYREKGRGADRWFDHSMMKARQEVGSG